MRIVLQLGDQVGDGTGKEGHNNTQVFVIESNFSREELKSAYEDAVEALGFNYCTEVCCEESVNHLSHDHFLMLEKVGIVPLCDVKQTNLGHRVYEDDFAKMFLAIIKLGNAEFEYTFVPDAEIHIGGYGLF